MEGLRRELEATKLRLQRERHGLTMALLKVEAALVALDAAKEPEEGFVSLSVFCDQGYYLKEVSNI